MYRYVYTLRSLPGTFAEPNYLCPSRTSSQLGGRHIAFYATDSVYNRVVRVERLEDIKKSGELSQSQSSNYEIADDENDLTWGYTVMTGAGNFSVPKGITDIPLSRYHTMRPSNQEKNKHTLGEFRRPIGDVLLVCDSGHNKFKILCVPNRHSGRKARQSGGIRIVTLVGNGQRGHNDGSGDESSFNAPTDACVLRDGSLLVTDTRNNCVRRIAPYCKRTSSPSPKTLRKQQHTDAGGWGSVHYSPLGSQRRRSSFVDTLDTNGAPLYDNNGYRFDQDKESVLSIITRWAGGDMNDLESLGSLLRVTTVAGGGVAAGRRKQGFKDGVGPNARFHGPSGIECCSSGAVVVSDEGNNCLRVMLPTENPDEWQVVTPRGATYSHMNKRKLMLAKQKNPDSGNDRQIDYPSSYRNGTASSSNGLKHNDKGLASRSEVSWTIRSPKGIGILNGDGHHGEVVAVSHQHGLSVLAIDLNTMQIIANEIVAGKTVAVNRANNVIKSRNVIMSYSAQSRMRSRLKAAAYTAGGVNWRKEFQFYDRDNSGQIDFPEFNRMLRKDAKISMNMMPSKDVKSIFDMVDSDGNGLIDLSEFLAWMGGTLHRLKKKSSQTVGNKSLKDCYGHTDGKIDQAYFNSPNGILVRPDQSLLIADSGNSVVRHIKVGAMSAERFWEIGWGKTLRHNRSGEHGSPLTQNLAGKKKSPRFTHRQHSMQNEDDLNEAGESLSDSSANKSARVADFKSTKKIKTIGSRLVNVWSSGQGIAENFLQDMQGLLQDKDIDENIDEHNVEPSSSPTSRSQVSSLRNDILEASTSVSSDVPRAPSSRAGVTGLIVPSDHRMKRSGGSQVNSARGWRIPSVPGPIKVHSKGGNRANTASTSPSKLSLSKKDNRKGARKMHERFVGLRGVRRTRAEIQEAHETRQRLARSEKRKQNEKRIRRLTKGEGRVASGSSKGVLMAKSKASDSNASIIKYHPHAKLQLDRSKGVRKVAPSKSSSIHLLYRVEDNKTKGRISSNRTMNRSRSESIKKSRRDTMRNFHSSKTLPTQEFPARKVTTELRPSLEHASFMRSTLSSKRRHDRNKSKRKHMNVTQPAGKLNSPQKSSASSEASSPGSSEASLSRSLLHPSSLSTPLISLVNEAQYKAEKLIHLMTASMLED